MVFVCSSCGCITNQLWVKWIDGKPYCWTCARSHQSKFALIVNEVDAFVNKFPVGMSRFRKWPLFGPLRPGAAAHAAKPTCFACRTFALMHLNVRFARFKTFGPSVNRPKVLTLIEASSLPAEPVVD